MTAVSDPLEFIKNRPPSIGRMFLDRVEATPDREAYRYPVDGTWKSLTWAETKDRVWAIGAGLLALGLEREQRVAIASSTRLEWILADLGINCAGLATTTVYPNTTLDDVGYILADSDSRVVFAEDTGQAEKVLEHRGKLDNLQRIVLFDGESDDDLVMTLAELEERGRALLAEQPTVMDDAVAATKPDDLATLIYTSGTTGRPKGVRLTHDNWVYDGMWVEADGFLTIDDLQYLWLPLSHSFGKALEAIQLRIGFPSAVDGDQTRIVDNLAVVKPTWMAAAPRIFEKAHSRIVTGVQAEGGLKPKIFDWAFRVGKEVSRLRQQGKEPSGLLAVQHRIADKLVFSKIRERFGGRLRFFISGAAALSKELAEWFDAAGIRISEGYGLTETSASTFVNPPPPGLVKFGTVGTPAVGTEVKIAEDGEVLIKGPGVMHGYHNLPEETAEVLTDDGWFHTGDIGELDEDGYLRITDRKKDLIKTSGGKYVAPQKIEINFKAVCPYASQMVVHGDNRSYCIALITLDPDAMQTWAEQHGHAGKSYEELIALPEVREMVEHYVNELNTRLERWETIKKFEILPRDLSVEEGELTPSMKVKRRTVEQKHQDILNRLYED
ncbi:MAG: AMP-dependent synthetase/ligase [Actinomycetota bacterium]